MKHILPILLCLALSGCATFKDFIGGTANVPVGFELTHECFFVHPTKAAVVGFRFVSQGKPDVCGQVMLPIDQAAEMSRTELMEYLFAQMLGGAFTPCKEAPDVGPVSKP